MTRILITDSGVGGLSVVAYAERFLRTRGWTQPVELTFANAAPDNDYGYNAMQSRDAKLGTFDSFLRSVTERYSPDMIYVACNTLSVLMPDTPYVIDAKIPVKGIIETAVALLLRDLAASPDSIACIFGTKTTIDSGIYPRLLEEGGIAASRIVTQACPGLADTISEDREGSKARDQIRRCVESAIAKLSSKNVPVIACLACTHYGYRKELFAAAFEESGIQAAVLNPNESAVDDLFPRESGDVIQQDAPVRVVSRYALPAATVETLAWLLQDISPATVDAIRDFELVPDLFEPR